MAASNYSLSDEEAVLLGEILSTSDVNTQNDLIARMKKLRMKEEPQASVPSAAPPSRAARGPTNEGNASDSDNNRRSCDGASSGVAFTQFQKLEENVLSEYDKRLSRNPQGLPAAAQQRDSLASNQPALAESTEAGPSDVGSVGPSSV